MSILGDRRTVRLVLAASFIFRLFFVAHDMRDLVLRGPLYDDSFYSFAIARNIAAGYGSTFDRVQPTNGYQPLYVLLLVPLYWMCGQNATAPIYAALVLSSFLNVLTGLVLYRLVRRHASAAAALYALVLWSFGPAIVRQALNGLETALAMFLLAASLEYYMTVHRSRSDPSRRQTATLGLLLGLAVFARVDAILFVGALGIDLARRGGRAALRRAAPAFCIVALLLVPWCVASQLLMGEIWPESGTATRFLSEAYATHDVPVLVHHPLSVGAPPQLLAFNLSRSMLLLGTAPGVHVGTRLFEILLRVVHLDPDATLYVIGSLVALLVLGGIFVVHRQRLVRGGGMPADFDFLYLYSALLVAAYSFVVFGHVFFSRYYYPIFFFSILVSAFAFEILLGLVGRAVERRRQAVALAIIGVHALALPYMSWNRVHGDYRFLNVVDWIAAHTPPGARIGVFNSGAIGYFSDRQVTNLDGKVNHAALQALRHNDLRGYVDAQGIDYVIDHEWILRRFLLGETGAKEGLVQVAGEAELGVRGWEAYRIQRLPGHLPLASSSGLLPRLQP